MPMTWLDWLKMLGGLVCTTGLLLYTERNTTGSDRETALFLIALMWLVAFGYFILWVLA